VIGDRDRLLPASLDRARDIRNPARAVKQAVLAVQMKMDEIV
jgi:hypothetical protein